MGSGILIAILGLDVCSLSVFLSCVVSGDGPDIMLTTHLGRPALVYLFIVLIHSLLLPLQQGSSTRGARASFVRPGKGISQNTMRYEY